MCGIAGQVGRDPRTIQRRYAAYCAMQQTLARRGPDQRGMYICGAAALIHARLAVVDLENGLQPMQLDWQGETYVLVYNGELYNTHELRAALLRLIIKGHGIAAPLPGIETDITEGVGVSVEVVIGVVICKIGKAAHTQRVGFCQSQIDPAHQNVIRLLRGDLDEIHLWVIAVIAGVHQLLPFCGGNWLFR